MKREFAVLVVAVLVLFAGCVEDTDGGIDEPYIASFSSTGGECINSFSYNWSVESREAKDGGRAVNLSGNIEVEGASYTVDHVSLTEPKRGEARLEVDTGRNPRKEVRRCTASIRYNTSVRIPSGYNVSVYHDGEEVSQIEG